MTNRILINTNSHEATINTEPSLTVRCTAIRNELEAISKSPYTTERGEIFLDLSLEWFEQAPASYMDFLDEVASEVK